MIRITRLDLTYDYKWAEYIYLQKKIDIHVKTNLSYLQCVCTAGDFKQVKNKRTENQTDVVKTC